MNRARLTATAYHEAGHAVIAFLFGFRVTSATIIPSADYLGFVAYRPRGRFDPESSTPGARMKIERMIIAALAGDAAQRRFAPRSSRNWQTTADREAAVTMALAICSTGESATAYLAWLTVVARNLVDQRWKNIERLALQLLEKRTLTGEEIRASIIPPPAAFRSWSAPEQELRLIG